MFKGKMVGEKELIDAIKKIAVKFPDRVAAALYAEAQIEMTESKRRCPVWNPANTVPKGVVPGALRASGTVHPPVRGRDRRISVELSYGGPAVAYAIYVHENPDAYHAIGEWKYLESVLKESAAYMASRLAARLQLSREAE